jgi:hypothetical protein
MNKQKEITFDTNYISKNNIGIKSFHTFTLQLELEPIHDIRLHKSLVLLQHSQVLQEHALLHHVQSELVDLAQRLTIGQVVLAGAE